MDAGIPVYEDDIGEYCTDDRRVHCVLNNTVDVYFERLQITIAGIID